MNDNDNGKPGLGGTYVRLGEITKPRNERSLPASIPGTKFIGLEHVESYTGKLLACGSTDEVRSTVALFRNGDILYGRLRPYLNKVILAPYDGACSAEFIVFPSANDYIDPRYLLNILRSQAFLNFTASLDRGDRPRVSWEQIATFLFYLPCLAEQLRRIALINELVTRARRARAELLRLERLNFGMKQAILSEAFGAIVDTAYRQPLGQIAAQITSGSRNWSKYYGKGEAVFVLAGNVRPLSFDLKPRQLVDPPRSGADARRTLVELDDILITIVGANTGDVCRVNLAVNDYYVCQSVAKIRLQNTSQARFLELFLNTENHGRGQIKRAIYGQGRPHLGFTEIKALSVPVVEESISMELVRLVDARFAGIEKYQADAIRSLRLVDKLECSILAKALGEASNANESSDAYSVDAVG